MSRRGLGAGLAMLLLGCSWNPALDLAAVTGGAPGVELTEVPFHPQEEYHCGPSSLLTVLEHSAVATDYETAVERVYVPDLEGSLQVEMAAAVRRFERVAYTVPPEPEAVFAEVSAGRPVLVLLNLGLPSSPVWHYAVVVGWSPDDNRIVMRSGGERRSVRKARAWLRQWDWAGRWALVALRPGDWPAAPRRDRMLQALADFEETAEPASAAVAWRRAAEAWPGEPLAWLGAGNSAFALDSWATARAAYDRALELDPGNLPARLNLAQAWARDGAPCKGLATLPPELPDGHPLRTAQTAVRNELERACRSVSSP